MENIFINKAEKAGIISIDILDYRPTEEIMEFDLKDHLYMGLVVKEKQFRESLSVIDFSIYDGKIVAVICSVDAIIPPWVYMLLAEKLYLHAFKFDILCSEEILLDLWKQNIQNTGFQHYKDQKVVVRARADIDPALYLLISVLLKPLVKSLMYGEIGMPKVIFKN